MLVSLNELLCKAKKKKFAVGAFNCPNLESIIAVIKAAEKIQCPVILSHAEIHNSIVPIEIIAPIMLDFAKKSTVPVCVHLDQGTSFEMCIKAIRLGFGSIMYDASGLDFETNLSQTREMVRIAHASGVSVEAGLGHIFLARNRADSAPTLDDIYTSPQAAKKFVEITGVDAMAIAFGTLHSIYKEKPILDLHRIREIKAAIDIPLVMHGGSGLAERGFRSVNTNGITKINYYTYMTLAGGHEVVTRLSGKTPNDAVFYHYIPLWAAEAMKKNVKEAIRVFSMQA